MMSCRRCLPSGVLTVPMILSPSVSKLVGMVDHRLKLVGELFRAIHQRPDLRKRGLKLADQHLGLGERLTRGLEQVGEIEGH